EPGPDRIVAGRHHDGDRPSLSFDRRNRQIGAGHDHVYLEAHQLPRQPGKPIEPALAVAGLQDESLPFNVAKFPHPLTERFEKSGGRRGTVGSRLPDPCDLARLLRVGGERRGEEHRTRASKERAPVHYWITSSALPSSEGGIVKPRALAVLRLITSS